MSASQPANLVRVVRTSGLCILRQLRLEEKLLRSPGAGNWCLCSINVLYNSMERANC